MYRFHHLIESINTDWSSLLLQVYDNNVSDFELLEKQLNKETIDFEGLKEIYPPENIIFKTFDFFNVNDLKVVILGQDPYHGPEQAMGMCFSVPNHIKIPPSLVNIYKEIKRCYYDNYEIPSHGNLTHWNEQGILLLNTSLTVRQSSPNSHLKYWRKITNDIIKTISNNTNNIIFLLWGNHAISKKKLIDCEKHYVLTSNHPSPLSANRGGWFGNTHFFKTNKILKSLNKNEIKW